MTDFADLNLRIDSAEVKTGVQELDKLTAAGARADAATDALAAAQALLKRQTEALNTALKQGLLTQEQYNRGLLNAKADVASVTKGYAQAQAELARFRAQNDNLAGSTKLAGHYMSNLAFQLNDVAVGLASGQKPMTVMMQQGSQIAQIMAQAGVGVGGLSSAVGGMVLNFAKAHPLLVAATVAVGALVAGFNLLASEINKTSAVQVTWQDTALGAFDVVSDAINTKVNAAFDAMGINIAEVWEAAVGYTRTAINLMIGAALAVPKAIAATYKMIPAAFGDAFYSAANLAIRALNTLARAAAAPLNGIVLAFNQAFGTKIPGIVIDGIGEIANPFAGAMGALGSAGAKSLIETFSTDYVGNAAAALSEAAQRRARMREAAEKAGEKAGKAGGKAGGKAMADEMADTFAKQFLENMAAMEKQILAGFKGILPDGNSEYEVILEGIKARKDGEERLQQARETWAEQDRQRALDTAYDIGDIIGGRVGGAIKNLADALDRAFPEFMSKIGGGLGDIGKLFGQLSGGAQVGSGVGGILKGLGIKSSQTGAEVGGMIGSFAGPIGTIAGSIIGGILGGMLKKTPNASATVSVIAGDAMIAGIQGNSAKLKGIASGMANSLISGLESMAAQLGAELGNASVSVGMRGKNYRVDPTGGGATKKSKGAIDFGKDEAAAIEFAIRDAISDGVFAGLGAGVERLLKGEGSLDRQFAKALSFKGVFDELFQMKDLKGFNLSQVDKWKASMDKIFAEAQATGEELAQLEELYGLKRAEILKENNDAALEIERTRRTMEIELMEAQGKTAEALAASRALELEQMDASLRPLQEQINATLDASAAQAKLAEEQARAADEADALAKAAEATAAALAATQAAIAKERRGLDIRLAEAQGDALAALTMRREDELAALDASNRELLSQIYVLEDAAKAAALLKDAEDDLAAARAKQFADDKAWADKIASERDGLMARLAELTGNTAYLRERELAALNPVNRSLQETIWAMEDAAKAADELAAAQAEQARAAESAAQAAAALARQRSGMQADLMEAQGDTAGATALRRSLALAELDASLRGLQTDIWAAQDAAAAAAAAQDALAEAQEAAADAARAHAEEVAKARDVLAAAYERESGALKDTIDKFRGFAESIRDFRHELVAAASPTGGYALARARFRNTSRGAMLGDEASLGRFAGDARSFLDASRENSASYVDYMRDYASVIGASGRAESGARGVADMAQQQLDALNESVAGLVEMGENVITVAQALEDLNRITGEQLVPVFTDTVHEGFAGLRAEMQATREQSADAGRTAQIAQETSVIVLGRIERLLSAWDRGDAIAVTNDADTPLITEAAP